MPLGAPFQVVPKSGCRPVVSPMLAISFAESGSTGWVEMSWFHGLLSGKTIWPAMKPWPMLSSPSPFCCSAIQGAAPASGKSELPAQARHADSTVAVAPMTMYCFNDFYPSPGSDGNDTQPDPSLPAGAGPDAGSPGLGTCTPAVPI